MATDDLRIMLVDDHALVREVLGERLQREAGLAVVGTVGTADLAITTALERRPDVILMDTDMPGGTCFDAARRIATACPRARIIYLGAFVSDRLIDQALRARASGYLTQSDRPETLIQAIREVISGGVYFSEHVRSRIVDGACGPELDPELKSRVSTLTRRELQVLEYIALAFSKKQIASTLLVGVKTVGRHTWNLMRKLDIHDRVELTRFAIREGIASLDSPGATEFVPRWMPSASHREPPELSERQPQMSGQIGAPAASTQ